jgi:hypothetical protein
MLRRARWLAWIALACAACSETTNLVGNGARLQQDAGRMDPDASSRPGPIATDAAGQAEAGPAIASFDDAGLIQCGKHACACSNALDDDDDLGIDAQDDECIGPADDDERSFATGAERDDARACQDCFFDANSGGGNDGCRRASSCATDGNPQSGSGSCRSCEVTESCVDRCRPLTPNGCDCFGCCEVHLQDGTLRNVMLRAGCSVATLSDPDVCQACIKAVECENPCEDCELCLGKGPADLPASCGGTGHACGDGEAVCDSTHPCPPAHYCQWGCCLPVLL